MVAKGPMPFGLMGKSFEIRETNGSPVPTENREKKLFIKFGYFAGDVTGFDGCNIFKAKLVDLGMGQYQIQKTSGTDHRCRHYPYPVTRYKSVSLSESGAFLQYEPFGIREAQRSLSLVNN